MSRGVVEPCGSKMHPDCCPSASAGRHSTRSATAFPASAPCGPSLALVAAPVLSVALQRRRRGGTETTSSQLVQDEVFSEQKCEWSGVITHRFSQVSDMRPQKLNAPVGKTKQTRKICHSGALVGPIQALHGQKGCRGVTCPVLYSILLSPLVWSRHPATSFF